MLAYMLAYMYVGLIAETCASTTVECKDLFVQDEVEIIATCHMHCHN